MALSPPVHHPPPPQAASPLRPPSASLSSLSPRLCLHTEHLLCASAMRCESTLGSRGGTSQTCGWDGLMSGPSPDRCKMIGRRGVLSDGEERLCPRQPRGRGRGRGEEGDGRRLPLALGRGLLSSASLALSSVFLSDILSLPRRPCFQVWDLLQTCREAWDECGCLPARPPSSSEGCGPSPEGTEALCLVSWSRFRAESFLRCRWCRGSCQRGQLGDQRPPLPLAGV